MQFLGAFSLLSFLAGPAVATYKDDCPDCTEIYNGGCNKDSGPVKLLIGNGGAGQSGLVKALADSFIQNQTNGCSENIFQIGWVKGDTTVTIKNLKTGHVHVGITYHKVAEQIAIDAGFAKGCILQNATEKPCYTFRDHFYLVGPRGNPAHVEKDDNIMNAFRKIYETGERGEARFLTRFDKSATNIKDSEMWIGIGQVPWAHDYSEWYHQYIDYPVQALTEAITQGEYTITDRGTYLTLMREDHEELLNRGDIITSSNIQASHRSYVDAFVQWVHGPDGQGVIRNYHKPPKNYCLYKGFPTDGDSLEPDNCTWDLDASKACAAHDDGDVRVDL
ncbi:hypothetical protein CNMCM5623_005698 [Aspergillus felis]|uniref:PBP domain-containing protein n=1 Tax=Aspergillus felis TaxID=1287682 RepID=A0A8H6UME0_9EURO|nr:hypothetical protein CNMCM5623_005698 [Aspergillus felis]